MDDVSNMTTGNRLHQCVGRVKYQDPAICIPPFPIKGIRLIGYIDQPTIEAALNKGQIRASYLLVEICNLFQHGVQIKHKL